MTPMLENELAFILGKPLRGPNCSIFDVLNATEYVTPALEIVDLRTRSDDPDAKSAAARRRHDCRQCGECRPRG
jgi:2-oxo-hept-3-ene-1,7-dioate hydratase